MDRLSKALEKARAERAVAVRSGASLDPRGDLDDELPQRSGPAGDVGIRPLDRAYLRSCRVLIEGGAHSAVGAFKLLRTQVLGRMQSNDWRTLVVTSPTQGNGKTVTAINLAINLARHAHQNVLLADLDLRQPSIHKYLSKDAIPGISDFILGKADIGDILFSPEIEGLTVLPGHESFAHSSEALLLRETVSLLNGLRSRYSNGLMILDMPPVLAADDVMAFSSHWDAALVVVEDGRTTEGELRRTMELLKEKPIIGTVLTKSDQALPEYGY
jgi:capsular exopolysaccharide synthesis family protein